MSNRCQGDISERGFRGDAVSAHGRTCSIISVIDILLVAVIIYEFLALIQGTRAALMLAGVAALALGVLLSRGWANLPR